jgi:hypothetical protein
MPFNIRFIPFYNKPQTKFVLDENQILDTAPNPLFYYRAEDYTTGSLYWNSYRGSYGPTLTKVTGSGQIITTGSLNNRMSVIGAFTGSYTMSSSTGAVTMLGVSYYAGITPANFALAAMTDGGTTNSRQSIFNEGSFFRGRSKNEAGVFDANSGGSTNAVILTTTVFKNGAQTKQCFKSLTPNLSTLTSSANIIDGNRLHIGSLDNTFSYFNSTHGIARIIMWNRELTPTEITGVMNRMSSHYGITLS